MTDQPTTDELLFPLLVEASSEADLDINEQDIRDGHHRIEPFASLARKAFELGAKLAAEEPAELGAHEGFGEDGGPVKTELRCESQIWPTDPDGEYLWRYWQPGQEDQALALAAEDVKRDGIARAEVIRFREVTYHADREVLGRFGDWSEPAPLPPFDATEVREHPGTGQPMTAIEHPADGTLSAALTPRVRHYVSELVEAAGKRERREQLTAEDQRLVDDVRALLEQDPLPADGTQAEPSSEPTRLVYRSPSGRTEVAVHRGALDIRVLTGADTIPLDEVPDMVVALGRARHPEAVITKGGYGDHHITCTACGLNVLTYDPLNADAHAPAHDEQRHLVPPADPTPAPTA